jgi:hypothetical protein
MARWVEGAKPGEGFYTNTDLVTCELCGFDHEPGDARLYRCKGCDEPEHNVPDPLRHDEPRGGVHARCRDEAACRRRQTPRAPGKRELAEALKQTHATGPEPTKPWPTIPIGGTRTKQQPASVSSPSDDRSASPTSAPVQFDLFDGGEA